MANYRTTQTTSHNLHLEDGSEVELEFEPYCDGDYGYMQVHMTDTHLIVAYAVHDHDPSNPMAEFDGQGKLYTRNEGVITDNEYAMYQELGLDRWGGPQLTVGFDLGGERVTLMELAIRKYGAEHPEIDLNDDDVFEEHESDIELLAFKLYSEHWQAIAGPWVVPISYHSERGSTRIRTTTWDGDTDDLPDGIWVAEGCAQDNLSIYIGTPELLDKVCEYAEGVVTEYASWCEGDVYGLGTQEFERAGPGEDWEEIEGDGFCWGFIGSDYAQKTLVDEFFQPYVDKLALPVEV